MTRDLCARLPRVSKFFNKNLFYIETRCCNEILTKKVSQMYIM